EHVEPIIDSLFVYQVLVRLRLTNPPLVDIHWKTNERPYCEPKQAKALYCAIFGRNFGAIDCGTFKRTRFFHQVLSEFS
ncbi:MAG: hypothetical protein P8017_13765, partial [Deltaproteobacteria bacterium]